MVVRTFIGNVFLWFEWSATGTDRLVQTAPVASAARYEWGLETRGISFQRLIKDLTRRLKLSFSRCQHIVAMVRASLASEMDFMLKPLDF